MRPGVHNSRGPESLSALVAELEPRARAATVTDAAKAGDIVVVTVSTTTSELLQAHLPASKVMKAFNHIYAAALTTDGQPAGSKNRRALVIAGDDPSDSRGTARRPSSGYPVRRTVALP